MATPTVAAGKTRVGWIGTGVMGAAMAGHIVRAGYSVSVFNRSRDRAQELVSAGARWCESPRQLAADCDIVFSIVGFPRDVREVLLGPDGALAGARTGSVLVDMTTSEPSLAREIAAAATARGVTSLDAPVSGGDVGAKEARLSIMVGGDQATFEALQPLWSCMGKSITYQGGPGAGQHTKMVNQILIASNMVGVCEALLYCHKAGLNPEHVLAAVSGGAAGSWSLSNLAPRILKKNFDPGFMVEHFIKDMGIALAESKAMGIALPGLALAEQLYRAVAAQGHARKGTHALILALSELSATRWA